MIWIAKAADRVPDRFGEFLIQSVAAAPQSLQGEYSRGERPDFRGEPNDPFELSPRGVMARSRRQP